jgi:hypothetical protein
MIISLVVDVGTSGRGASRSRERRRDGWVADALPLAVARAATQGIAVFICDLLGKAATSGPAQRYVPTRHPESPFPELTEAEI